MQIKPTTLKRIKRKIPAASQFIRNSFIQNHLSLCADAPTQYYTIVDIWQWQIVYLSISSFLFHQIKVNFGSVEAVKRAAETKKNGKRIYLVVFVSFRTVPHEERKQNANRQHRMLNALWCFASKCTLLHIKVTIYVTGTCPPVYLSTLHCFVSFHIENCFRELKLMRSRFEMNLFMSSNLFGSAILPIYS